LNGDLKTHTASKIITAQGKALHTKYRAKIGPKTETGSKCRLCPQYEENMDHIITVPNNGKRQNIKQYDKVCIQLRSVIRKQTAVRLDKQQGYEQVTSEYTSHKSYLAVKNYSTVPHDNPENLVLDSGKGAC